MNRSAAGTQSPLLSNKGGPPFKRFYFEKQGLAFHLRASINPLKAKLASREVT